MLANQVVFISGAAGLIGQRFVETCLQEGASVVAADLNEDQLNSLESKLSKFSENLHTISLDLTSKEQVQQALKNSIERFGEITALVNTAYPRNSHYGRRFFDVEYDDFCENLSLNVGTTFLISKEFSSYFKDRQQGNIINLGSIYGVMAPDFDIYPEPMTMPVEYAAIKAAIIHMTKYMAQMLREEGVRVNCISPGGILDAQPESFLTRYNKKCGQQGMLNATHLDSTLLYLLSDNSVAVTGQNIVVDDGFSL